MKKFSKNVKLNKVLNNIYEDLQELGIEEIEKYMKEFKNEIDYNIYNYGNLLIYTKDVRNLYNDYASLKNASDDKIIEIYKRQVGYVARYIINE